MEYISIYNISAAIIGGILSFLSPCVLPLVPSYISLISGVSVDQLKGEESTSGTVRRAVILNTLAFIAGISVIFLFLGATAGLVGAAIFNNFWVRVIGGLVIIFFGLQMMGLFRFGAYYKDTRFLNSSSEPRGMLGSLILGLAFAAGWTPCIGPMMSGIIVLSATSGWQGGLILSAFYSLGLALPFLFVGLLFERFLSFYKNFRKHLHKVEIASGVLLILIGLLVASGNVTEINRILVNYVYNVEDLAPKLQEGKPVNQPTEQTNNQQNAVNENLPLAPEASFQTLDGKPFKISDLRGKVVLLNYWATWCVPCRKEIPLLNELQKEYEAKGFVIVGVSQDDTAAQIKDFQKDFPIDYTVLTGGAAHANDFGVVSFPTSILIDREGRIHKKIVGEVTRERDESIIKSLTK